MSLPLLSLVIPVFNEQESLPYLIQRLDALCESLSDTIRTEVWLVDDHSTDATPDLLPQIHRQQPERYHYLRLAANSGSHIALIAGLRQTSGNCIVFLAADLQDPPELVPQMLAAWREGAQVVWAVRAEREGISQREKATSNLFYNLLNRFSEVKLPPTGADFSLMDRQVADALLQSVRANPSLALEVARLGFRQVEIPYVKAAREHGISKWNLSKKLKAFADAFIATSYMPLRLMSYSGLLVSSLGFIYAFMIILMRLFGQIGISGWSGLMVVVLVFGGLQMMMLGIIGEYLWRTLEYSRNRPLYFIESRSDSSTLHI